LSVVVNSASCTANKRICDDFKNGRTYGVREATRSLDRSPYAAYTQQIATEHEMAGLHSRSSFSLFVSVVIFLQVIDGEYELRS